MPSYSLAQAKDQLARLVDEALAGENVAILKDGKPVVSLVPSSGAARLVSAQLIERIRTSRDLGPNLGADGVTLVRQMREEGA